MSHWNRLCGLLKPALAHSGDTHDLADVADMIKAGEAQLWAGISSILVTTVEEYPKAKVLTLWLAGGEMDELVNFLRPEAETWGEAQGCTRAAIMGRDGWMRALRGAGYEPAARLVMKDLTA